jgi:hypothetical protein
MIQVTRYPSSNRASDGKIDSKRFWCAILRATDRPGETLAPAVKAGNSRHSPPVPKLCQNPFDSGLWSYA